MNVTEITEKRQYLTFKLGKETFGVDVAEVRELLEFTPITKMPGTPDFMSGIINLRGGVIPVVNLGLSLRMAKTECAETACILVLEVVLEGESRVIGALADAVEEVIDLEPDQIQPAPKVGTQIHADFIRGMGRRDDQFVMILDMDRVFSTDNPAIYGPCTH